MLCSKEYFYLQNCICTNLILLGQGAGISVAGRIESGYVQSGETVLVVPANELVSVRSKDRERREREERMNMKCILCVCVCVCEREGRGRRRLDLRIVLRL